MAKTTMKKGAAEESRALAVVDERAALADALADFDVGLDDGLREIDGEDTRLPVLVWNMPGKNPATGKAFPKDVFFDTLNEKTYEKIRGVFVHLHKSNAFVRFDDSKNESEYVCSSNDRKVGVLRVVHPDTGAPVGTERGCDKCPDKEWRKVDGKNRRNCDTHYGVFFAALNDDGSVGDGFFVKFKRTGLPPFKTHLQKHHIGKHPTKRGSNVPLFAFEVTLSLELSDNGNYAIPVIERGPALSRPMLEQFAAMAKQCAEFADHATSIAEKQESKFEGGDMGATRADDFADD